MPVEAKLGQQVRVTVKKTINRASARKTIERLFMKDKTVAAPVEARSENFIPLPKRRGGCIWTKRPNKVHLPLNTGHSALITVTPQSLKDLASVDAFVDVVNA